MPECAADPDRDPPAVRADQAGAIARAALDPPNPTEIQLSALATLIGRTIGRHDAEALQRYVDMLVGPGVERGLLGPREADRIWDRHILNCAALSPLLRPGSAVADVGSGAGLPGIVIALLRPDVTVTLIEPLLRRATFLGEALAEVDLTGRVTVARTRAEDYRGAAVDVVVARAVAPLDKLAGWTIPLLRPGGMVLAMKGQRAGAETDEHRAALQHLGARSIDVVILGSGQLAEPTTVVVITAEGRDRGER